MRFDWNNINNKTYSRMCRPDIDGGSSSLVTLIGEKIISLRKKLWAFANVTGFMKRSLYCIRQSLQLLVIDIFEGSLVYSNDLM